MLAATRFSRLWGLQSPSLLEPAATTARNTAARFETTRRATVRSGFQLSTSEGRNLWTLVEEQFETTRIDIASDSLRFTAPWENLWNPLDVMPAACRAASFVRTGVAPAMPASPNSAGAIRILLVISRPAGILDAPFHSVAARLFDGVDGDTTFRFEVLRPPTFEAFQSTR